MNQSAQTMSDEHSAPKGRGLDEPLVCERRCAAHRRTGVCPEHRVGQVEDHIIHRKRRVSLEKEDIRLGVRREETGTVWSEG